MVSSSIELNYNNYMRTDLAPYIGEWIAVSEDSVVAHGKILKEVVERAKKSGKKFLIAKVPSEDVMVF